MRKLFARVTGGSKREHDADVFDTSSLLSPTFQSVVHAAVSREDDLNSPLISAAAQSLLDDIQEILYDTASLQDNTSGFDRLLHLLNSVVNNASVGFPRDTSPLETLLINLKHPLFSEKCNEVGLSTALMHALRLLRMYEIKIAKYSSLSTTASTMTPVQGVTFTASKRLCLVFSTLLSDQKSTEQIRQSLVKLVTFPLSALPEGGENACKRLIFLSCKSSLLICFHKIYLT